MRLQESYLIPCSALSAAQAGAAALLYAVGPLSVTDQRNFFLALLSYPTYTMCMSTKIGKEMISSTQAAEILGVAARTLVFWRRDQYGPQPISRIGRNFAYDREEVEKFAELRAQVARRPSQ